MSEENNFISLKGVSKIYRIGDENYYALDHINLNIERGKLVVILGPSGAGKSTLLNLLGGMDRPTKGSVTIDGLKISDYKDTDLTEFRAEKVGFIFQFYNILPSLTVKENVELVNDIVKNPLNSPDAIKAVGLFRHQNKFPSELSGGEQQRVSIARAIAKNPDLILADEPTGALDSATGSEILALLKAQTEQGKTVIIVTHNSLIADIADVVIKVKNGQIESATNHKNPKKISEVKW